MSASVFRLWGITLDCVDVPRVAGFWAALLGTDATSDVDLPGWLRIESASPGVPRLNFQPVNEPKRGKVRLHLDLVVDDIDAGIARVLELGGAHTGERHDYDAGVVVVLADPEGAEFCAVQLFDAAVEAPRGLPAVTLRPMTRAEYEGWHSDSVHSYAQEIAAATSDSLGDVLPRARREYDELLPDGQDTPGVELLRVLDGTGTPVGTLWMGPHPRRADAMFVFEIEIDEVHRGRGLGRAAMLAAERVVADIGRSVIGLNVFGPNRRARQLYDSLGYRTESTLMAKDL